MSSKSSVLADVQSAAAAKSLISPAPISPRYAETGNPTIRIEIHPSHPACSGLPPIHASTTAVRPSRTAAAFGISRLVKSLQLAQTRTAIAAAASTVLFATLRRQMVNDAFEEIADRRCKRAVGRDERADYDRHAGGKNALFDGSHAAAAANEKTNAFNECHDASFGRKIRSGKRRWSKACRLDDPVSRRHRCHTGCSRSCLL